MTKLFSSPRAKLGALLLLAALVGVVIMGLPFGANVVLFMFAGMLALGGVFAEAVLKRIFIQHPIIFNPPALPFSFVRLKHGYINVCNITYIHVDADDGHITAHQVDGEPVVIGAADANALTALLDEYAVANALPAFGPKE